MKNKSYYLSKDPSSLCQPCKLQADTSTYNTTSADSSHLLSITSSAAFTRSEVIDNTTAGTKLFVPTLKITGPSYITLTA